MTSSASESPVEIRVPAPNASVHGLRGACGSAPGDVSVGTSKNRNNGCSSRAGVFGGSAW